MITSRKIYIAVLVMALVVLAWDKTVRQQSVTDPLPADAQSRIQPPQPLGSQTPGFQVPSPQTIIEPPASALENPVETNHDFLPLSAERPKTIQTRNLFTASKQLLSLLGHNKYGNNTVGHSEEQPIQLRLSSIIISSRRPCAMINDEILFFGDTIGPYRLIEILAGSVVLQIDSEQTILPLDP
ncbi:MAG: hypothetical protein KAJ52_03550 [Sedimentisphaerales bacterium]|nr:hypothetical protein [Sedimentisphaerales bacterium]